MTWNFSISGAILVWSLGSGVGAKSSQWPPVHFICRWNKQEGPLLLPLLGLDAVCSGSGNAAVHWWWFRANAVLWTPPCPTLRPPPDGTTAEPSLTILSHWFLVMGHNFASPSSTFISGLVCGTRGAPPSAGILVRMRDSSKVATEAF